MTNDELKLETIEEWAYTPTEDSRQSTEFDRGYKQGVDDAKELIKAIVNDRNGTHTEKVTLLRTIVGLTHNRYNAMPYFQRPELSKEELLECAEEMRLLLEEIEEAAVMEGD